MSSPLLQRSREVVVEILSIFDHVSRLTARALAAAERGDPGGLMEMLHQRQRSMADALELVDLLTELRAGCRPEEVADFALLVDEVGHAAEEVQETDGHLARMLTEQRDRLAASIARSNTALLAHVTYGRALSLCRARRGR